jgi:hypothetical protein
MSEFNTDGGAL